MEQCNNVLSKLSFILASYTKCHHLAYILFSAVIGGSPWLSAAHSIDVDLLGDHVYAGIVKISFSGHNTSDAVDKGFLCDDDTWSYNTAKVVCKQAGYIGVHKVLYDAEERYGTQSGDFYLHELSCTGSESSLMKCSYKSWNGDRCLTLAGVHCKHEPSQKSSDGFFGSFFPRVFVSTILVPLFAITCVLCRCCFRYRNERRRYASRRGRSSAHTLSRNTDEEAQLEMEANSRAALPSYDDIMKDTSGSFPRLNEYLATDEDSEESGAEPPPSYDTVIGSWTDQRNISTTYFLG